MNIKKVNVISLIILSFLLCSGCQNTDRIPFESNQSSSQRISAKVIKVVDGDTIHVKIGARNEKIRFLLIDAPEYTMQKEPYGKEAKTFIHNLLSGQTIELEYDIEKRDQYGRLLAYIYFQGQSVQKQLIERGLAEVKVYPPNQKYVKQYRQYEAIAQQEGINIWSY